MDIKNLSLLVKKSIHSEKDYHILCSSRQPFIYFDRALKLFTSGKFNVNNNRRSFGPSKQISQIWGGIESHSYRDRQCSYNYFAI